MEHISETSELYGAQIFKVFHFPIKGKWVQKNIFWWHPCLEKALENDESISAQFLYFEEISMSPNWKKVLESLHVEVTPLPDSQAFQAVLTTFTAKSAKLQDLEIFLDFLNVNWEFYGMYADDLKLKCFNSKLTFPYTLHMSSDLLKTPNLTSDKLFSPKFAEKLNQIYGIKVPVINDGFAKFKDILYRIFGVNQNLSTAAAIEVFFFLLISNSFLFFPVVI